MGRAPSRRSPQQGIADRTTYVSQQAVEVMRQHDERQRLLAIAERSPGKRQLSRADVCISAHFVVILVGDVPRFPPERPLAWSTASCQLLHEGRKLRAVHLDGLRKVGLHDGSMFAEPVIT